jgi:hypothetical protein
VIAARKCMVAIVMNVRRTFFERCCNVQGDFDQVTVTVIGKSKEFPSWKLSPQCSLPRGLAVVIIFYSNMSYSRFQVNCVPRPSIEQESEIKRIFSFVHPRSTLRLDSLSHRVPISTFPLRFFYLQPFGLAFGLLQTSGS